jgi:hypothetical protein
MSLENEVIKVPKYALEDRDSIAGKSPRNGCGTGPSIRYYRDVFPLIKAVEE